MFYFDKFQEQKVLKSNLLNNALFTTRNGSLLIPKFPLNIKNLVMPEQTHSDNVQIVDDRTDYPSTDALILTDNKKSIALKFADCVPLIFYDNKNNIGAIAHAGWRGTASQIGIKTVLKMQKHFCSQPQDIIVLIGPAIGICCYEVSDNVKEQLLQTTKNCNGLYDGKMVNLKMINQRQLEEIGIEQIDVCPYCTCCNNELFYSYRKENGTSFRHYAFLALK